MVNEERLVDTRVTYTLEHDGRVYVVENVPARVGEQTCERFFSPSTIEHLQEVISRNRKTDHVIHTPIYRYTEKEA